MDGDGVRAGIREADRLQESQQFSDSLLTQHENKLCGGSYNDTVVENELDSPSNDSIRSAALACELLLPENHDSIKPLKLGQRARDPAGRKSLLSISTIER